jgi:hypothetical protein
MQHDNKSFKVGLNPAMPPSEAAVWIVGRTGSGKTTRLVEQSRRWAEMVPPEQEPLLQPMGLIFASLNETRLALIQRLAGGQTQRFASATPLGFFQAEVTQFWSLLMRQLNLKTQFPLRLHPETEQMLAARLWQSRLESGQLRQAGVRDAEMVSRTLDLLQLAAFSAIPHEQIPELLQQGWVEQDGSSTLWNSMGEALDQWWRWCLARGILTYGILTELYWRYLLPQPAYQQHLSQRYGAVFADDVDEYPAVMRSLLEFFLDRGLPGAFTFNPSGSVRLGLGADPTYLSGLAARCQVEMLPPPTTGVGATWGPLAVDCIREPLLLPQFSNAIQVIQTVSKAQLLRQTAETIASAIQAGEVKPEEIAIVSPGFDAITRYTLQEILTSRGIATFALNSQYPLISSPLVRGLLTLSALVYPGLGQWVDREAVSEMLVVLSQRPNEAVSAPPSLPPEWLDEATPQPSKLPLKSRIDPVRAGLLADHCFIPDLQTPHLLPAQQFSRWDRLGYRATQAYEEILQWMSAQRALQPLPNLVEFLERAIQDFFAVGDYSYDQLASLRGLMQTVRHTWEVEARLRKSEKSAVVHSSETIEQPDTAAIGNLIQLLRNGTITANLYPAQPRGEASQAVMLSTLYQYRMHQCSHRWQFWLDAGSPLWFMRSGVTLFAAPLFWRHRTNRVWTAADSMAENQSYLEREVMDLLDRAQERVYLCHCDLAVNGQEQEGALLPMIQAAVPVNPNLSLV